MKHFSFRRFLLCCRPTKRTITAVDEIPARHIPTHAAKSFLRTTTPSAKHRDEFLSRSSFPHWKLQYPDEPQDSAIKRNDSHLDMPLNMTLCDCSNSALPFMDPHAHFQTQHTILPGPSVSSTSIAEQADELRARGSKRAYEVKTGASAVNVPWLGHHSAI